MIRMLVDSNFSTTFETRINRSQSMGPPRRGQDKYEPLYGEGSPHESGEDHAGKTDRTTVVGTLVIAPRSIEEVHLVS